MREAKLEKEDFDSSVLTKLDSLQKKFVEKGNVRTIKKRNYSSNVNKISYTKSFQVPALVDQTPAKDYYGNDVKDEPLRRGIVGIVEQLSNVFNAIIEVRI